MTRRFLISAAVVLGMVLLVPSSSDALGNYYIVLWEKILRPEGAATAGAPTPYALTKAADGGYLLAGAMAPWQPFVIKLSPIGDVEWQRLLDDHAARSTSNYSIVETNDGGALLIGETSSAEVMPGRWFPSDSERRYFAGISQTAYAVRLDAKGKLVWRKAYGRLDKPYGGKFLCGMHATDGFLLVGTRPKDWLNQPLRSGGVWTTSALWILKLNNEGAIVWESELAMDGEELLDTADLTQEGCSLLASDSRKTVVVAISAKGRQTLVQDGHRIVYGPQTYATNRFVLVVRLDTLAGRELGRFRLDEGVTPRLFAKRDHYVLIDNQLSPDRGRRAVRTTYLDQSLRVVSQRTGEASRAYFEMADAVAETNGGFHLTGFVVTPPNERGASALAYLTPTGEVTRITTFGSGLPSWHPAGIALGHTTNEIAVLEAENHQNDMRLTLYQMRRD